MNSCRIRSGVKQALLAVLVTAWVSSSSLAQEGSSSEEEIEGDGSAQSEESEKKEPEGPPTAFRIKRLFTGTGEVIENAVLVVRSGKVSQVGADLSIPDGARIVDRPDMTLVPGLIQAGTDLGLGSTSRSGQQPHLKISDEADSIDSVLELYLQAGFTTVAISPRGQGMPGQGAVYKTALGGKSKTVDDAAYMLLPFDRVPNDKSTLVRALDAARKEIEKREKARKDWEEQKKKAEEAKKKAEEEAKKKAESEKNDSTKPPEGQKGGGRPPSPGGGNKGEEPKEFNPPTPAPQNAPIVEWLEKKEGVYGLVELSSASNYVHFESVMRDEDLAFHYKLRNQGSGFRGPDLDAVLDRIAKEDRIVLVVPTHNVIPSSINQINYAVELRSLGADVGLYADSDARRLHSYWLDVAGIVRSGFLPEEAVEAMTRTPAKLLGLEDRVGSIQAGRDADFVLYDGSPFDVGTRLREVYIEGKLVHENDDKPLAKSAQSSKRRGDR